LAFIKGSCTVGETSNYGCSFLNTERKSVSDGQRSAEQKMNKHYAPNLEQSNNSLKGEILC